MQPPNPTAHAVYGAAIIKGYRHKVAAQMAGLCPKALRQYQRHTRRAGALVLRTLKETFYTDPTHPDSLPAGPTG